MSAGEPVERAGGEAAPPFPRWLAARDPMLAHAESNGLFCAFEIRRRAYWRRHSRFGSDLAALVRVLVMHSSVYLLLAVLMVVAGPCFGIVAFLVGLLAVHGALGWAARRRSFRVPLRLEDLLLGGTHPAMMADMRLIPFEPVELGEALILERTQREWAGRLVAGYLYIAAGGLIVTLHDRSLGWGDGALLIALVVAAVGWTPVMALEHGARISQKCVEDFLAVAGRSAVDRSTLFLSNIAVTFFYMPMMFVLVAFEVGFAYLLVRELLRLVLLRFPEAFPPEGDSLLSPEQISQGLMGLLLLCSLPLARRLTASAATFRQNQAMLHAVELSQLGGALLMKEEEPRAE